MTPSINVGYNRTPIYFPDGSHVTISSTVDGRTNVKTTFQDDREPDEYDVAGWCTLTNDDSRFGAMENYQLKPGIDLELFNKTIGCQTKAGGQNIRAAGMWTLIPPSNDGLTKSPLPPDSSPSIPVRSRSSSGETSGSSSSSSSTGSRIWLPESLRHLRGKIGYRGSPHQQSGAPSSGWSKASKGSNHSDPPSLAEELEPEDISPLSWEP